MGFNFRKSIKVGPARVNLSKSGVGFSVGTKGARISKSAKGKTRISAGIPGTGLTYSKSIGSKRKTTTKKSSSTSSSNGIRLKTHASSSASAEPAKKSWPVAIILTILAFGLVGILSFALLFIAVAVISLFNPAVISDTSRNILIWTPIVLGIISAFVVFRFSKPEKPAPDNDFNVPNSDTNE